MEFESIHSMIYIYTQLKFIFYSTTSFPNLKLTIYQFLQFIDKPADMKSITYRMMHLDC